MSDNSNQKGFAAVEALLIFVIVAMIAGVGYYVWHSNKQTNATLDAASKSAQSSPSKVPKSSAEIKATAYKFPELGVEFTLPSALKGMTYTVQKLPDDQGNQVDVLYLQDPNIADVVNKCNVGNGGSQSTTVNFAAIDSAKGTYDAVKEQGEDTLLKQFPSFHILVGYPNGNACSSEDATLSSQAEAAIKAAQKVFVDSFKSTATETK